MDPLGLGQKLQPCLARIHRVDAAPPLAHAPRPEPCCGALISGVGRQATLGLQVYIYIYIYTCAYTYIYIYIRVHIHMYIHTYIRVHTHIDANYSGTYIGLFGASRPVEKFEDF